jgi:hypothetical protein
MAEKKDALSRVADSAPDAVTDVVQAVLSTKLAAAGFDQGAILAAVAAVPPAMAVVKSAFALFGRSKQADADAWWQETAKRFTRRTKTDFHERIAERIDDRGVHETIVRAARALSEIVDPTAIPIIAELTAEYLQYEWKADRFFRGALRLLSEVGAAELAQLRTLLRFAVRAKAAHPELVVYELHLSQTADGDQVVSLKNAPSTEYAESPVVPDGRELFALLKADHLGMDNPGGFPDTISGPSVVLIRCGDAEHLVTLFDAE